MRFSLIAVTATGLAIAGYYTLAREPSVDLSMMTGSVDADAAQSAGGLNASMAKTERLSAQLVMPPGSVDARTARSPLVVAQASGQASGQAGGQLAGSAPNGETAQATGPAVSQLQGGTKPAAPSAQQPAVDESALRYFAARGDTARFRPKSRA